jgi:hypothetical protein
MPYTPDPVDSAEPTIGREVQSAAAEFRALKADKNAKDTRLALAEANLTAIQAAVAVLQAQISSISTGSDATALASNLASASALLGANIVMTETGITLQSYARHALFASDLVVDGVTDNTAKLVSWIAKALAGNRKLILPAGSIVFNDTFTINQTVEIEGAGAGKTTLIFNNAVSGKSAFKYVTGAVRVCISRLTLIDGTFGTSCGIEFNDAIADGGGHVQKNVFFDVELSGFLIAHKLTSASPLLGATHAMCSETLWLHCRFSNNLLAVLNQNCQAVNNLYLGTDFENFDSTYRGILPIVDAGWTFIKDEAGCGIEVHGGSMIGRGKWFEWEYKAGGNTLFSGAQFYMRGVRSEARTVHVGKLINEAVHGVTGSLAMSISLRDINVVAFGANLDIISYGGRLTFGLDNVNVVQGTGSLIIRQFPTIGRTANGITGSQGIGRVKNSEVDVIIETTSPYGTWNANYTGLIHRDGGASSSTNSSNATDAQGWISVLGKGSAQQLGMQLNDGVMPKLLLWNNDNMGNTVSSDLKIVMPKGGRPLELVVYENPQSWAGDSGWELYVVEDQANWTIPGTFNLATDAELVATTGTTTNKSGFYRSPAILPGNSRFSVELRSGKTGWTEGRMYLKKTGATAFPGIVGVNYI